jgi:hypothetical protein
LTQDEVNSVTVPKAQVPEPDGWYVGTAVELADLAHKKIFKWVPPVMEDAPPAE